MNDSAHAKIRAVLEKARLLFLGALGVPAVIVLIVLSAPAKAEYQVDVGDVVEIVVTSIPEMQRRVTVRTDGNISFPLLGTIMVAGLSPAELRTRIQTSLAGMVFQRKTADGRTVDFMIRADEVIAGVVEFRPVYVSGDVAKPGEYVFRPGMTARQAVTAAGGYSLERMTAANRFLETAKLDAEYLSLWSEYVRAKARVWALNKLLGKDVKADAENLSAGQISAVDMAQILATEADRVSSIQSDRQHQKDFLSQSLKEYDSQIRILTDQQQVEEQGAAADVEELEKVLRLYGRGDLVSPRVTDARRAVMLSATRKLQISSQLMQVRRQRLEIQSQIERLADQQKADLLRDLQEAAGRVDSLKARIAGLARASQHFAGLPASSPPSQSEFRIVLVRKSGTRRDLMLADEDQELYPGDVLQVGLDNRKAAEIPTR